MEKKDDNVQREDSGPSEALLKPEERRPGEGAESDEEGGQNAATAMTAVWQPHEVFIKDLIEMGISRNAAEKGLYYTGNISAEAAAEWVFDNLDKLPDLHEPFEPNIEHGFATLKENTRSPFKMVFVVNDSLKMGVGKVSAQVGHAAVGLYRELVENRAHPPHLLAQWQENGETKIVVKAETTQTLMDLEQLAVARKLPTFLVTDAGRTQVMAGAVTVLGVLGESHELDDITGNLKLL